MRGKTHHSECCQMYGRNVKTKHEKICLPIDTERMAVVYQLRMRSLNLQKLLANMDLASGLMSTFSHFPDKHPILHDFVLDCMTEVDNAQNRRTLDSGASLFNLLLLIRVKVEQRHFN